MHKFFVNSDVPGLLVRLSGGRVVTWVHSLWQGPTEGC